MRSTDVMADLQAAYHRSAYPALGISLERVLTEPALRGTLELLERVRARTARLAVRAAAGRRIERTAQ